MLHDPKRDVWSEAWFRGIVREVADYIERHGWRQGRYSNRKGEVCLVGALRKVGMAHGHGARAFVEELEVRGLISPVDELTMWNDRVAQTKAEVVAWLRFCAARGAGAGGEGPHQP